MPRLAVTVLSPLLLLTGVLLVADHEYGTTAPEVRVEAQAPPPAVAASRSEPSTEAAPFAPTVPDRSGVPVQLVIPFGSTNHPDGVTAPVTADPLLPDGDLFVPVDPLTVSWANQDAMPGADRGTAILVGHINYRSVVGALSDLAEYAQTAVGQTFSVVLADGRALRYRVTGGVQYDKDQLAADPGLRRDLYDQESVFGEGPGSGRLVLVSCGGAFDHSTGSYQDNVFLFAMPAG
jgi:hypothetical protein